MSTYGFIPEDPTPAINAALDVVNKSIVPQVGENSVGIVKLNADSTLTALDYTGGQADAFTDADGYDGTVNTGSTTMSYNASLKNYNNAVTDNAEISTNQTSFQLQKTITYSGTCESVTFEQRASAVNYSNPDQTTRIRFNYDDATNSDVDVDNSSSTSYVSKTADNPSPEKTLTSVQVYQKTSSTSLTAYARNFQLDGSGEDADLVLSVSGFSDISKAYVYIEGTDYADVIVHISDGTTSATGSANENIDLSTLNGTPTSITINATSSVKLTGYCLFVW